MECPFCAEVIKDGALVCKHCGRDLKVQKPLIEENQELIAFIGELQQEVNMLRAELARHKALGTFWAMHLAIYIMPPILLLLIAHVLLVVKFDVNPLIMRVASMLIPLPFGFALAWFAYLGWRMAAGVGVVIGIVSVACMMMIVGYTDNVPVLPQNFREWRETAEYAVSIALATVTGNILAMTVRTSLPQNIGDGRLPRAVAMRIATLIGPHVSKQALRRRAEKIEGMMNTAGLRGAAMTTATGAIYTGIRALIGI